MLSCGSQESFCIIVELLFGVSRMHHRQHGKHHSLVTGRKVIKKLLAFFSLLLQVIRYNGRKIVVLVLLSLPIRDIGSGLTMMNTSLSRINTVLSEDNLSNLKTREKDKILRKIEKQTASLAALLDELEELGLDKKEVMRKHGV